MGGENLIIYEANETDFFNNGLGTLPDATSALVTEERNGEFVLDVVYPQQGLRSELLTKNRIIKADAGHELKDQRFVIKKVTPTMGSDGYIYLTVHAEHVSYITADLGVTPNLTLSGNATQALEQWQANLVGGHPDITVDSDIISTHETSLDITKATNARQVLGGVEGSILDTWGGEYKFDNLHISLRGQRGTTANTLISYGRNLLTFEQEDDITDTYTSIYPYANVGLADGNNSKLVTVDGYFVDSQYVDRYPNRKLLPVDFGSEFTDYKIGSKPSESDTGIYTTETEIKKKLTELAKQYIENNRIGIPKVSTKITFADLSKTSEYAPLEQVNLCDIIPIRFEKLGIDTTIKVTRVVWNVLLDEYDSIELGDLRTTLGESISALESKTTGLANAVITAQSTADNQNSIFRTNGGTAEPVAKKVGDLWFKTDGDYQYMYQWDGAVWHEVVNTKTADDIAKEVDKAKADAEALSSEVELAKKQAQEAFAKAGFNADEINNVKTATSEVTETLTSTVRQASELSESLKNVASETASRYSTVSSELSGARDSLNAKASELAKEVASNSANITKANSQLYSQSEGLAKVSQSATKMEQTMTDLSGRVHTVETTASETKEALADAKGNITTLTKRADGTDTKIADAQGRVQTLESRAGKWDLELSKKVDNTTYNAGIQNLGNQINLKANKSDLDGYATKAQLSVESDRITQQASAISSVTVIANGANNKIDSLSFGGRNLLDRSDGQFVMGYGITNTTWENGKAVLRYNSADVSRNSEILPQSADFGLQFPVARGEQLTQSIYLDTDANINSNNNFEFTWFDYKDGHKFVRANIDKVGQNTYRLWGSYTWDKNDSSNLRIMDIANLYKVVDFRNSGTYLAFYHPQLEKASRPSDYSLSQNDLQRLASENTASQINQYNTGTVQPIKGIANDALGKANNANNKIDGLRIGGRNLLKNSRGRFQPNGSKLDNYAIYKDTTAYLENGKTYTISAKAKDGLVFSSVHDPTKQSNKVTLWMVDAARRYNVIVSDDKTNTVGTVFKWGSPTGTYQLRVNTYNANNSGYAEFVQIQEGTRATEWQPSDLDLPDTIVTTVTEVSNASQIVKSSGIYTEVNSVRTETTGKLNEVNNRVSDVSGKVDNVNNKIDNLKVGGRNLLDNSSFAAVFNDSTGFHTKWYLVNSGYATWNFDSDVPFSSGDDRSLMVQIKSPGSDTARGIMYQSPVVKMNIEYTISFWAKARANGMKIEVESNAKRAQFNLSTAWQKYEGVITFQSDNRALYIHNAQGGAVGQFLIFHPQLELGNKASDWSMSQNDVQKLASKDTASQINTFNTNNITPIKTTVNQYTHTTDNLSNKVTDIFKDIGYDQSNHTFTDKFKTVVETAGGTKETYKALEGKINGIVVGGKNLLDNSDGQLIMGYGIDNTTWTNGKATLVYNHDYSKTNKSSEILPKTGSRNQWYRVNKDEELTQSIIVETDATYDPNGVYQFTWFTSEFSHRLITANIDVLGKNKYRLWCSFKWDKDQSCNLRIMDIQNLTRVLRINTSGTYISFYHPQIERGNKPSDWGMSDNDINKKIANANVSIAKTNETIKTVDGNVTTVKNNLDKTKSIVTQLSNLFGVNVGDSSISVTNGGVLVKGKQISIDGNTYIKDASIDGAKIKSLDAGKITTGTLNAANVKVINLDANNIKSGTISGNNLSLNLDNGTVSFKKGILTNSQGNFKIDLNQGFISIKEPGKKNGILMTEGVFYVKDENDSLFGEIAFRPNNDAMEFSASNIGELRFLKDDYSKGNNVRLEVKRTSNNAVTPYLWLRCSENETYFNLGSGTNSQESTIMGKPSNLSLASPNLNIFSDEMLTIHSNKNLSLTASEEMTVSAAKGLSLNGVKYLSIDGSLSVRGSKNAIVQTTAGWTKINAYETAEYYFGDLGTAVTDDTSTVRIGIEPLFNETVNTDIPYQVFVTSYGKGYAWVAERGSNYFVIKSSVPNLEIGYEIKAKRKGYENVRLEIDKHMEVNK